MAVEFVTTLPDNVKNALKGILTDIPGPTVKQNIVTALTWGVNNLLVVGEWVNDLGLCVSDGKLCYTNEDIIDVNSLIPDSVRGAVARIPADKYGREVRSDIVEALQWLRDIGSAVIDYLYDLGLTVVDGKLCVIYGDDDYTPYEKQKQESIYSNPGTDPDPEGYTYIGNE